MRQTLIHKSSVLVYISTVLILVLTVLTPFTLFHPKPAKAASLPAYRYTKKFDATNDRAASASVATDTHGNVYVVGKFSGTIIFDGSGGHDSQTAPHGKADAYLTKYNSNGSYGWTKVFDNSASGASAYANSVTTDSQDNVYLTGYFSGTVIFDGTGGHDSHTDSSSNTDAYLTKYNSNGSYGWTKTFDNSTGNAFVQSWSVATDSLGNVYFDGSFYGTITFDGTGGNDTQASGVSDAFITKYNANGTYAWTKIFNTTSGGAYSGGVATDIHNNVYLTGGYTQTITFGGSDTITEVAGGGTGDAFLTKYDSNGSYVWTKTFDSTNSGSIGVYGQSVATDSVGNIYETGGFGGTVNFAGTSGTDNQTDAGGNSDVFLTKYNTNGSYAFTKTFDSTNTGINGAWVNSVTTDSQGNVYMTGNFGGTTIFDGTGGHDSQTDAGGNGNAFLTKYDTKGSYAWTKTFDSTHTGSNGASGNGVAADSKGNVYEAGNFSGTAIFDGTGGLDSQTDAGSNYDSYLTSYQAFTPLSPGPAGGDANADGIADVLQSYVTTVNDSISNNYAALQASNVCTNGSVSVSSETSNATQDASYSYPAGMMNFTTNCVIHGFTASISLFFYGVNSNGLILRKYNTATHTYSNVPNVSISQMTIAGQTVAKVSYQITDGGPLDQDGKANGIIVDPVGLAKVIVSAPNTGYGVGTTHPWKTLAELSLGAAGLAGLAYISQRTMRTKYRYYR